MQRRRTDGIKLLEQSIINSLASLREDEEQEQGLEQQWQESVGNKQTRGEEKELRTEEDEEREGEGDGEGEEEDEDEGEENEDVNVDFDMWSPLSSVFVVGPRAFLC